MKASQLIFIGVIIVTATTPSFCQEGLTETFKEFQAVCAAKAKKADEAGVMTVPGKDGWFFLGKELRHISVGKFWGKEAIEVSLAAKPKWADPLPAILDFKDQLDKLGIELLMVPVPPKALIYPEDLSELVSPSQGIPRLDIYHQQFYKLLGEKGVAVLDLTELFLKIRNQEKESLLLYCRTDTHFSPSACVLIAREIKARLSGRPWLPEEKGTPFRTRTEIREITGDLAKSLNKAVTEKVEVRIAEGGQSSVDSSSPVMLLGDSHCLVFHAGGGELHGKSAGLADQLAVELGIPIDLLGTRNSGSTAARINLMRRVRTDKDYLSGKKLIIWCFTAREFTESDGWRKVPIVK